MRDKIKYQSWNNFPNWDQVTDNYYLSCLLSLYRVGNTLLLLLLRVPLLVTGFHNELSFL